MHFSAINREKELQIMRLISSPRSVLIMELEISKLESFLYSMLEQVLDSSIPLNKEIEMGRRDSIFFDTGGGSKGDQKVNVMFRMTKRIVVHLRDLVQMQD